MTVDHSQVIYTKYVINMLIIKDSSPVQLRTVLSSRHDFYSTPFGCL